MNFLSGKDTPSKDLYVDLDEESEISSTPAGWRRKGWCLAAGAIAGVMLGGAYGEPNPHIFTEHTHPRTRSRARLQSHTTVTHQPPPFQSISSRRQRQRQPVGFADSRDHPDGGAAHHHLVLR